MSKRNFNHFATCHDRDIKVWDKRRSEQCLEAYSGWWISCFIIIGKGQRAMKGSLSVMDYERLTFVILC